MIIDSLSTLLTAAQALNVLIFISNIPSENFRKSLSKQHKTQRQDVYTDIGSFNGLELELHVYSASDCYLVSLIDKTRE